MKLLEPFENEGILVKRPREKLEREISHFTVLEHDGIIYGSAALYPYQEAKIGEMAAFAVHPAYQGSGDGDRLLRRIEQSLPIEKQRMYNWNRRSQIFIKQL